MTPLNTIIEEIMNKWCDKYGHFLAFESDALTDLTITIQRAYEAGQSEERAKAYEEGDSDGYLRCLKYYFPEDYEESDKTNGL